jgi:uncharacterized protein (DUF302 family)
VVPSLQSKRVKLFALVDHIPEAAKVGLQMPPTKLLILGNAKAGTPLMLAAPGIALGLPLKILVAQDSLGKVCTAGGGRNPSRQTPSRNSRKLSWVVARVG